MIHDACVEVTCDGDGCTESVYVQLEYVYRNYGESSGHYDSDDESIRKTLVNDHDWVVRGEQTFCSEECGGEEA